MFELLTLISWVGTIILDIGYEDFFRKPVCTDPEMLAYLENKYFQFYIYKTKPSLGIDLLKWKSNLTKMFQGEIFKFYSTEYLNMYYIH